MVAKHLGTNLANELAAAIEASPDLVPKSLVAALTREPRLRIFDRSLQRIGQAFQSFDHYRLASWLVGRAQATNVERALSDLATYAEKDTFRAFQVVFATGTWADELYKFDDGMTLCPVKYLPFEVPSDSFSERVILGQTSFAMFKPFEHPRVHQAQGASQTIPDLDRTYLRINDELRLVQELLSLLGKGTQLIAFTTVPADNVPSTGLLSWHMPEMRTALLGSIVTRSEAMRLAQLRSDFQALSENQRQALRVPLRRLVKALCALSLVDKAIELGVAMEALYLSDQTHGELTYRLALRGATFLSADARTTESIFKDLKQAYTLRSQAVHTGTFSRKNRSKATGIIDSAIGHVSRTLAAFIRHGPVKNWEALVLQRVARPEVAAPLIAGVDACRAGWLFVLRDTATGELSHVLLPSFSQYLELDARLALIAVDMPIGLPARGSRDCDLQARRLLGEPRRRSVFPSPIRGMLGTKTFDEAAAVLAKTDGRGLQKQVFALLPKIFQVDNAIRSAPSDSLSIIEVHPEVSFAAWNSGNPMLHAKRSREGRAERQRLIANHYGSDAFSNVRAAFLCREVAHDDIADAFAALWTAERRCAGNAEAVPQTTEQDEEGLEMKIWY